MIRKFGSAFLLLLFLMLSGCSEEKLDMVCALEGTSFEMKNSAREILCFDGSEFSGDMAYRVQGEKQEDISLMIPYSDRLTLAFAGEQAKFFVSCKEGEMSLNGRGITEADLLWDDGITLTGENMTFTMAIQVPSILGIGLVRTTGTGSGEVILAPTDTGFRLSGITGTAWVYITSSQYSEFHDGIELKGGSAFIDLSRYGEGILAVTEGDTTREIQFDVIRK